MLMSLGTHVRAYYISTVESDLTANVALMGRGEIISVLDRSATEKDQPAFKKSENKSIIVDFRSL